MSYYVFDYNELTAISMTIEVTGSIIKIKTIAGKLLATMYEDKDQNFNIIYNPEETTLFAEPRNERILTGGNVHLLLEKQSGIFEDKEEGVLIEINYQKFAFIAPPANKQSDNIIIIKGKESRSLN